MLTREDLEAIKIEKDRPGALTPIGLQVKELCETALSLYDETDRLKEENKKLLAVAKLAKGFVPEFETTHDPEVMTETIRSGQLQRALDTAKDLLKED